MRPQILTSILLLLLSSAFAQAPAAAPAKPKAPVLLEVTTHYIDDVGANEDGVLVRVRRDGTVEYTSGGKPDLVTAKIPAGTVARLGALLNDPAVRRLKPAYPAWQSYGFSAISYKIVFFSGAVERTVETANVFPVKGRRDEYPTALLEVLCASLDVRSAVDPESGRRLYGERGDCNEFPAIAKPAKPPQP